MKQSHMQRKHAQAGFTLIELIIVIVILGILAATALPKFANLGADARLAKMKAASGAIKSAAATFHGQWLAAGSPPDTPAVTILQEGSSIAYSYGYPTAAGIVISAGSLADYTVVATSGTVMTLTPDPTHPLCSLTYTQSTATDTAPVLSANPTLTNCQ